MVAVDDAERVTAVDRGVGGGHPWLGEPRNEVEQGGATAGFSPVMHLSTRPASGRRRLESASSGDGLRDWSKAAELAYLPRRVARGEVEGATPGVGGDGLLHTTRPQQHRRHSQPMIAAASTSARSRMVSRSGARWRRAEGDGEPRCRPHGGEVDRLDDVPSIRREAHRPPVLGQSRSKVSSCRDEGQPANPRGIFATPSTLPRSPGR